MTLSEELAWRGFVNQTTYADPGAIDGTPITFYWGVDPSADSMTVGNLAAAMMARHFIAYGHRAVLLVGGATGLIGDPDGKDTERDLRPPEEIERNKAAIAAQYRTVFGELPFETVDNYDWFKDMGYLGFLRDIGKHFSMTQLLDRDFIRSRIGEGGAGISYAEFSYSLIQGYDFLHLFREKGVTLQLAGADQWGNSISGVHLIRKLEGADAHIWTAPLVINRATGKKFGKSEGGAVWLDPGKTSAYDFYQFWLNVDDEGVIDYVKIYTLLSPDDVAALEAEMAANPAGRPAQRRLAHEVTALVHGELTVTAIERVTAVLFGGADFADLSDAELDTLAGVVPAANGKTVVEVLVASGLAGGTGDARRLISGGAISVNGRKLVDDEPLTVPGLIKKGKNSFLLAR